MRKCGGECVGVWKSVRGYMGKCVEVLGRCNVQ